MVLRNVFTENYTKQLFTEIGTKFIFERESHTPRTFLWTTKDPCICRYKYGRVNSKPQAWTQTLSDVSTFCLSALAAKDNQFEEYLLEPPNSCQTNCYKDETEFCGKHADDEQLFWNDTTDQIEIISFSIGQVEHFRGNRLMMITTYITIYYVMVIFNIVVDILSTIIIITFHHPTHSVMPELI